MAVRSFWGRSRVSFKFPRRPRCLRVSRFPAGPSSTPTASSTWIQPSVAGPTRQTAPPSAPLSKVGNSPASPSGMHSGATPPATWSIPTRAASRIWSGSKARIGGCLSSKASGRVRHNHRRSLQPRNRSRKWSLATFRLGRSGRPHASLTRWRGRWCGSYPGCSLG